MAEVNENKRALIGAALAELVATARSGGPRNRVGLMAAGSELPVEEFLLGAATAMRQDSRLQVVGLGPRPAALPEGMDWIETPDCEADIAAAMEKALDSGDLEGAVALHYPFPVGVTTMGRVFTPARGKAMILASSTGISAPQRACAMLRNAVYGLATAKAMGIAEPTLGVLNLDAAPQVMRALSRMAEKGYALRFGQSVRKDGGALLRGNDILAGAVDVCVCDTLTGNVLAKVFAAFGTGGGYEAARAGTRLYPSSRAPRARRSSPTLWPTRPRPCAAACPPGWRRSSGRPAPLVWMKSWKGCCPRPNPARGMRRPCRPWFPRMRKSTALTCWIWKTPCMCSGKKAFTPKGPWAAQGRWSSWRRPVWKRPGACFSRRGICK